ncbi:MAG: Asp-tRNA(Asn)/Glu-tRNA(Gln) amidotransferase subunit GatB [Chitinophagaceae bacterium]|nr:Asp-tRNA(Asn)/Glu-tRNA(Gln) amidotransferase subunit GatB [Chitinophagaceae bacterium]
MIDHSEYEIVVGLEVHAQLSTKSKLFCGDSTHYGSSPNTQVSAISLAHPGTLPKMNRQAIEYAIALGLACHCEISRENYFARKNYFYPDLPKGYQVSQHTTPICRGGFLTVEVNGEEKKIRLNRIHLEEDAGKSIHDADPDNTCIDLNRAGTPLVEIVTEPDIRSSEEAFAFLTSIRRRLRYLGVCDGNMEEGSLRCDANISVRLKGDDRLGTRTEIKNLNSIRHVKKAIDTEAERQIALLGAGEKVIQQTRSFVAADGSSFAIRDKEEADDYRYFPEPDLTPFRISEEQLKAVAATLPRLPEQRIAGYMRELQLSAYDAALLTDEKSFSDYFEALVQDHPGIKPKRFANWLSGPVKEWLNEQGKEIEEFPLSTDQLASLVALVEKGRCSFSAASGKLFQECLKQPEQDIEQLAEKLNLLQVSDTASIEPVIEEVLQKMADKVEEYRNGKKGLLALFVGEVMKRSKGKADPKLTNELLIRKLNSSK